MLSVMRCCRHKRPVRYALRLAQQNFTIRVRGNYVEYGKETLHVLPAGAQVGLKTLQVTQVQWEHGPDDGRGQCTTAEISVEEHGAVEDNGLLYAPRATRHARLGSNDRARQPALLNCCCVSANFGGFQVPRSGSVVLFYAKHNGVAISNLL